MAFFKEIGRAFGKVAGIAAIGALTGGAGLSIAGGLFAAKKMSKSKVGGNTDLVAQQRAATAAQSAKIEAERAKIAQQKSEVQTKMTVNNRAASRRRVRGGLFGDTSVDQNVQARLG